MKNEQPNFLAAALQYAAMGLAVIPIKPKTNEAFLRDWPNVATTDEKQIRQWWSDNPNYNVGIVTGRKNRLLVIDLDLDEEQGKYGYELAQEWQSEHGAFPGDSWMCKTAHGGYHLYFWNDQPQGSPTGLFFDQSGIDIRADGACVVAPPSVREEGLSYSWEQSPEEFELQKANEAVRRFIKDGVEERQKAKKKGKAEGDHRSFEMPEEILEGSRRDTLVALIGSLRAKNVSENAIRAAVAEENEARCKPPMTEEELEREVLPALTRDWPGTHPYFKAAKPEKDLIEKLVALDAANRFSWTDKGFSELFMAVFGEVLGFNPVKKNYMFYDGSRWRPDLEGMAARRCAKRFADALQAYAAGFSDLEDKRKSDFIRHSVKLMAAHTRETLIRDARDLHVIENDSLDAEDYLLNCPNCTLDLSGPEVIVREHSARDLISKVCAADYDAAADCPIWKKALDGIMQGDSEKVIYLQKILGLTLTGCVAEEEFYFLFGSSSRNGKSTVAETVLSILGDYGEKISAETLAARAKDSRTASPDLAKLHGKRMVVASEPPKRMLFDSALVKSITGRDRITARYLHENEFAYIPKFKLFINTNFLPIVADETLFKSERVRVISFNKHFLPEEQDRLLKDKLLEERSGILNWLLDGWRLYQEEGLLPPKSVVAATEEYAHDSDKLGRFVEDCLIPAEGNLPASLVYEAYADWCEAAGLRAEGRNNFYSDLKSRGLFRASGTIRGKTVRNIVAGYKLAEEGFKEVEDAPF